MNTMKPLHGHSARPSLLVGLLLVLATPGAGAQQDICPTLKRLLGHAETEFASIKGAPLRTPNGRAIDGYHGASIGLLGGDCTVQDPEPGIEGYYSCDWSFNQREEAAGFASRLNAAISNCVQRRPEPMQSSRQHSTTLLFGASFSLPGAKVDAVTIDVSATSRTVRGRERIEALLMISPEKD